MPFHTSLTRMFDLRLPVIMAPMFLVSNEAMMQSAMDAGIMGTFPSLNYRKEGELAALLNRLNGYRSGNSSPGNYGVNLIVQKTNTLYPAHLEACVEARVPFYITSLGNPSEVIAKAHSYGARVFCDITNLAHAEKCAGLGCDGFIAVTQGAGGHAGPYPAQLLVPALKREYPDIPVVVAGGIANGAGLLSVLALGASGASIGTRFIASEEARVSEEYKQAIVDYGMEDIFMTERLSGTPCSVIGTPYARKIGEKQGRLEKWLSSNKTTRRYFKMLVQLRGWKRLEEAIRPGSYHTLWSAGQSTELIHDILPCIQLIERLEKELEESMHSLEKQHQA